MLTKTYLTLPSSSAKEALQQAMCILDAMRTIHLTPETPPTALEGHSILTELVSNAVREAVLEFPNEEVIISPWSKIAPELLSDEERDRRNKELLQAFNEEMSMAQLCANFNISSVMIYKIIRKMEKRGHTVRRVEHKKGQPRRLRTTERNAIIKEDYLSGMTYNQIALKHGISRARVTETLDMLRREGADIPYRIKSKNKIAPAKINGKG